MPSSSRTRLWIFVCALVLSVTASPLMAAEVFYTGPNPAFAPSQDRFPGGYGPAPSTVHRDPDGSAYVLRGRNEKQYLSGYNVTWIDKNHVLAPVGVGTFE